ncbi:GSCFA domain-containing protein [Winogradskyella sp. PE311]|uniref:GSCFA domain-containing protein n=1 Tax=Winogradskyella sp. PE311 TaxID=3366943 RepID=UPI0039817F2C
MKLQTIIKLREEPHNQIDYDSKLFLLGSCFSENIGNKFEYHKFQASINPFGILFHPLAIEHLIKRAINSDYYSDSDLYFENEQWFSLEVHSKLNNASKTQLLNTLNSQIDATLNALKSSTHIVITLGTSWVYRHISSDKVIANCHKLPQKQFLKELLPVEEITGCLEVIIALVKRINPKVNFIFTVSPVRHTKDGIIENMRSKSHLISAVHHIIEPRQQVYYFPAYEIMLDELRDYRFYGKDMIHPSEVAIDYIWDKFKTVWLVREAIDISEKVSAIQAKKLHRPFNPSSEVHQKFLAKLQLEIEDFCKKYSNISF